jgi:threonine/homoserine/homoserine lactone efflux protein|uniref:LysE family transporter n=1 Tax=Fulvivirga sp. TaxID=1931237 RepID=UPI00404B0457
MMIIFGIAFIFSFLGSIPPGSINISIIQLAVEERISAALRFALAAALIEYPYVIIAIQFEDWLTSTPLIMNNIRLISAAVMLTLGAVNLRVYFRPTKNKTFEKLQSSGFRKGLIISILNPLAIPFWIGITAYLKNQQWLQITSWSDKLIYGAGVSIGTFTLLALLAYLGKSIKLKISSKGLAQLMPAIIFLLLGLYALLKLDY